MSKSEGTQMSTAQRQEEHGWLAGRRARVCLVAGVIAFVGLFQLVYLIWLYPVFGYYGFNNIDPTWRYLLIAWIFSIFPALWMPIKLTRPSQLIYWVLYLTVFIPSMFVPLYNGLEGTSETLMLMATLFLGLAIVGLTYLCPVIPFQSRGLSRSGFWKMFRVLALGLVLWVMATFRGHLHIVSFWDVYDLRFAADDLMEGSLVHYAVMWLSAVIGPFFLALGLHQKRPFIFLAGVSTEMLVYSATAAKSALLSIPIVLLFYFVLRCRQTLFGIKFTGGCVLLFVSLFLVRSLDNGLVTWALSLVLMRTFGNSGLMTSWYSDFFQRNPVTHYSHVTGVNWIWPYAYANPLGIEVGSYYSGDPTLDANAHFWATDGLAAWGLPGILLVSALCALVFQFLDSAAQKHDVRFTAILVSFAAINLANVSLFTTLLSGGLGMLMAVLIAMPREITTNAALRRTQLAIKSTRILPAKGGAQPALG